MRCDYTGHTRKPNASWLAVALAVAACSSSISGIDNARLVVAKAEVEHELEVGHVGVAADLAAAYERRVPGPEAQALRGQARWATGDLLEAEAMLRRGGTAGVPAGMLGLARTSASRGEWGEALRLARVAAADPDTAAAAHALMAGVALATDDLETAVAELQAGAAATGDPESAGALREQALLLETLLETSGDSARAWRGGVATIALERTEEGALLVPVRLGGTRVSLELRLDASRSMLSRELAMPLEPGTQPGAEILTALEFDGLSIDGQLFRVVGTPAAGDGVLGFDILAAGRWMLDLTSLRLSLAPAQMHARGSAFDYPTLRNTHWARVRLLRHGVGAQLLLMPRLDGRVVSAGLALTSPTVIDQRQLPLLDAAVGEPQGDGTRPPRAALAAQDGARQRLVELRFGGWRDEWIVGVADLYPLAGGGRVAPQMLLGRELLTDWRLRWSPAARQLALTPVDEPG